MIIQKKPNMLGPTDPYWAKSLVERNECQNKWVSGPQAFVTLWIFPERTFKIKGTRRLYPEHLAGQ